MTATDSPNLDILDHWIEKGFCYGKGDPKYAVCMEQAVALCLGIEPIKSEDGIYSLCDKPEEKNSCIDPNLAQICRNLNDMNWTDRKSRSKFLAPLAFEQLQSRGIDSESFLNSVMRKIKESVFPKIIEMSKSKFDTRNYQIYKVSRDEKISDYVNRFCASTLKLSGVTYLDICCVFNEMYVANVNMFAFIKHITELFFSPYEAETFYKEMVDIVLDELRKAKVAAGIPLFQR